MVEAAISVASPADVRYADVKSFSLPKVKAFFTWSEQTALGHPGKKQFGQGLPLWPQPSGAFSLFPEDGRVANRQ